MGTVILPPLVFPCTGLGKTGTLSKTIEHDVTPHDIVHQVFDGRRLVQNSDVRFRRNVDTKALKNVDKHVELGLFVNEQGSAVNGRQKHRKLVDRQIRDNNGNFVVLASTL
jgi:hypothetical protein